MDPYSSPFETVDPAAMGPNALIGVSQPAPSNVVGWAPPQQPEGRSWSDKIKEALMLAATVTPIGKMMGSKLGRLALGAGAGAGAAAIANPAQAADDGSGDPVLDALNTQLSIKQQQYQAEISGSGGRRKGDGPNAAGYQRDINDLIGKIKQRQTELHNESLIETPAQKTARIAAENAEKDKEQARADARADVNRTRFLEGAGAGGAAGLALSAAGGILTRGRVNRFSKVAEDLTNLTKAARKDTYAAKGTADEVAGMVDEADALRGQPKSFGDNPSKFGNTYSQDGVARAVDDAPDGPFKASKEAKAAGNTVAASREATGPDLGENFEKPYTFKGEWALPALGGIDYGVMKGIGSTKDNPEDKQAYDDMANFGLGLGLGAKGARAITKPFSTPVGREVATAPVNAARNKLKRELGDAAGGAAPAGGSASHGANPAAGTGPGGGVKAPPGKGGGLPIDQLQARSRAAAPQRAAFHADPANQNMLDAIGAVQGRRARVTADTIMRELKAKLGDKVDGVPLNRKQIGLWLSRHGYL